MSTDQICWHGSCLLQLHSADDDTVIWDVRWWKLVRTNSSNDILIANSLVKFFKTCGKFLRVSKPPGKSWIFSLKYPGPGKSWKISLVLKSPRIYLWFILTNMPFMYRTPCINKCMEYSCCVLTEQFLCNLWWTFCDGLYCHAVYTEQVTAVNL